MKAATMYRFSTIYMATSCLIGFVRARIVYLIVFVSVCVRAFLWVCARACVHFDFHHFAYAYVGLGVRLCVCGCISLLGLVLM